MGKFSLSRLKGWLAPLGHLEWAPVVGLLVAVAVVLGWGFIELADEVLDGEKIEGYT